MSSFTRLLLAIVTAWTIMIAVGLYVSADEMTHSFKNPSFSGVGTSAHWLTIENQEANRKKALKDEIKAYQEDLEREAENTTLANSAKAITGTCCE